ncbi:hypothetical protein [uncultured Cellulomonas sp.]|uniref:hypothetical protein n=1 Tax=uncultured Cellulomonas sp. TaxID=189682 RepID=UPI002609F7BF|nr:hypothetical protein [uncultured Cellulomonas sp.]
MARTSRSTTSSPFVITPQDAARLQQATKRSTARRSLRGLDLLALLRETENRSAAARKERAARPGRRGWSGKGAGRVNYIAGPFEAQGTTVQVCGLWPFAAGSSLPTVGVPLGHHLVTGGTVCGDPVMWFLAQLINFPSCMILGRPGLGKSTLGRRMVSVLAAWGVIPMVLSDLKPDYVDLIEALDGLVIRVGRGRGHINPLDMGPLVARLAELPEDKRREALAELRGRRLNTFTGLLSLLRGDRLQAHENTLVSVALRILDQRGGTVPPLPSDVYAVLQEGPLELRAVALDRGVDERYRDRIEPLLDLIGALSSDGPFGDVFAGQTTTPIAIDRPVAFDMSSIDDGDLLFQAAAQSVCWSYGSLTVSAAKHLADAGLAPTRHYFMVMDELWRMLRAGSFMVDFVDALTRLNRNRGLAQALITHTMLDLKMANDADTAKAWGFVERSAMVYLGGLAASEMGNLEEVFGMSGTERRLIAEWADEGTRDPETGRAAAPPGQGKFLLKLGKKPGIPFKLDLTPVELDVNNTNRMWASMAERVTAARRHSITPDVDEAEAATRRAVDDVAGPGDV